MGIDPAADLSLDRFLNRELTRRVHSQFFIFSHISPQPYITSAQKALRLNRLIKATNIVAPMIDQTIGKCSPPISTAKISFRPSSLAIQRPISAPINPSATETRQPPW